MADYCKGFKLLPNLYKLLIISFLFTKILILISCLIRVAFITLLERKILGYIQYRKGPNKVYFMGIFQPFADAIKLFTKIKLFINFINYFFYFLSPLLALSLILFLWINISIFFSIGLTTEFEIIFILIISRLNIYSIIFSGWSRNSKYAILGSYRGIAQSISYEVSLSFIIISIFVFYLNLNFLNFSYSQNYSYFFFRFFFLCLIWFFSILAETNRTPFDLAEGESELVSGFNIEYSGTEFALIFIAEYGNIIFIRFISRLIFFGGWKLIFLKIFFFCLFFLILRGTLIRIRYDKLIFLSWKIILPNSIFILIIFFIIYF